MSDCIIVGGSGGIGSAILNILEYPNIFNIDIKHSEKANFLKTDLRNSDSILSSLKKINLEKVSRVVFSAGFGGPFVSLDQVEEKLWDEIFLVNLKSSFLILKEILPYMKKNNFGRIVFIASSQSLVGAKNSVAYSSSKHAVLGLMKSLADEWGEFGITCNSVSPGFVETQMGIQEEKVLDHKKKILEMTPSRKIAKPFEIARIVKFLLSEDSSYINGANWTVDGGITAI
jgi:3-oxoacyl-[acyl-carrier protein] reductase